MRRVLLAAATLQASFLAASAYAEAVDSVDPVDSTSTLEQTVVTATREDKLKRDLAESVTAFDEDTIQAVSPSHPSDILNRAAGVHVNNLGGEGHMTAIRQPITTRGVYLFLEDGIPIRPSGFFNHNALYEVNIPQSGHLEVVKGPGSALYGSDAIGGMINSLTAVPPEQTRYNVNAETGSWGWKRSLVSAGTTTGKHGINVAVNYTDNDGYRDESAYDRASLTGRWDFRGDIVQVKTLLSYTEVDQSGSSSLEEDDYKNKPKKNLFHGDVAFREVEALRLSSEFIIEHGDSAFSMIPYYRNNTMTMSPSWMVTYDPNIREDSFQSLGLMTKYRVDLNDSHQLITGLDIDYTPSSYKETAISHTKDGDIYTGYQELDQRNYDFDADQTSLSPYIQYEAHVLDNLIATLGLRYDYFRVRYQDNLSDSYPNAVFIDQLGRNVTHLRAEDQSVSFDQFSPKLGLVYQLNAQHDSYFNYRHAFSIPSVGTLYRSGTTQNTSELEPIKADSMELGFRGLLANWLAYEVAVYRMTIEDDLVTVINGFERNVYNAGETRHEGIEVSLSGDISDELAYAIAYTKTRQQYESFSYTCCFPAQNIDVSGNDVGKAPEQMANVILAYVPRAMKKLRMEIEWQHLGEYYTDETNTSTYDGHDLYNLRANYQVLANLQLYGRVQNISDERYSVYTSSQVGDPDVSYMPGMPRAYYAGFRVSF